MYNLFDAAHYLEYKNRPKKTKIEAEDPSAISKNE